MIGNKFWKWTIISEAERDKNNRQQFVGQCECGTQRIGKKDSFISGVSKQCKVCFDNRANIYKIGDQINDWTILEEGRNDWWERHYLCRCKCGKEKIVRKRDLERNKSTQCVSCHISKKNTTHNFSKSLTYITWASMKGRCNNPNNKSYRWYGGRGIKVSPHWDNYENFLKDVGQKPDGKTLDRIDPDGNYEPGNVRWATTEENHQNRRNSKAYADRYVYVRKEVLCKDCLDKVKGY